MHAPRVRRQVSPEWSPRRSHGVRASERSRSRYPPSISARSTSSRKNGLPSERARIRSCSLSGRSLIGSRFSSSSSELPAGNGSSSSSNHASPSSARTGSAPAS